MILRLFAMVWLGESSVATGEQGESLLPLLFLPAYGAGQGQWT
jgi:hypothetical protein